VSESETSENLNIRVLDISKKELSDDFAQADSFERSGFHQKVYAADVYEVFGAEPFAVVIGDFEFDRSNQDVALLEGLSRVAAAAHAPFIAGAGRAWRKHPTPFAWTRPAEAIIRSHRRMLERISTAVH
jgi:type VI secretion system protein ImpC